MAFFSKDFVHRNVVPTAFLRYNRKESGTKYKGKEGYQSNGSLDKKKQILKHVNHVEGVDE